MGRAARDKGLLIVNNFVMHAAIVAGPLIARRHSADRARAESLLPLPHRGRLRPAAREGEGRRQKTLRFRRRRIRLETQSDLHPVSCGPAALSGRVRRTFRENQIQISSSPSAGIPFLFDSLLDVCLEPDRYRESDRELESYRFAVNFRLLSNRIH